MKKRILGLLALICSLPLHAAPLDGTSGVVYQPSSYTFSDGDLATGFVWLAGGFSIPADASVTFNLPVPVSGSINGNDSGRMVLGSDVYLAAGTGLASGLKIDGQGKTVHLQGNLRLPANKTIEITSSLTIDGGGNKLELNGANFYINGTEPTTLRLKNMHLYGVKDLANFASIRFGSVAGHKLILENVVLRLAGDFTVDVCGVEIAEQVVVVGDYAINYTSNSDFVIHHGAMLTLGLHATFNYQPEDRLATHFIFKGSTSALYLAGGTLFAPKNTGIELTKGHLIVDHKSYLKQDWVADDAFGHGRGRIEIGNGRNKNKNMAIDIFPAAQLVHQSAAINYGNVDQD